MAVSQATRPRATRPSETSVQAFTPLGTLTNPVSLQEFLTFQYGVDAAVSNLTRYMPSYMPFKSVLQVHREKHSSYTHPLTHRSHRWTLYSLPPQLRVLLHQCKRNLRISSMLRRPRCSPSCSHLPVLPCSLLVLASVRVTGGATCNRVEGRHLVLPCCILTSVSRRGRKHGSSHCNGKREREDKSRMTTWLTPN